MATSEALIKYYDCLKDSFNKIQNKDNETALVNAALRPKIREELIKSDEVLTKYLDYIQVFALIYKDKFITICNTILVPLFKHDDIKLICNSTEDDKEFLIEQKALKVHQCIENILKSGPELVGDFVHSVIKLFPTISSSDNGNQAFLTYLKNSLRICNYETLQGEPLYMLLTKLLDKTNPSVIDLEEQDQEIVLMIVEKSYLMMHECIDKLDVPKRNKFITAMLKTFTNEFLVSIVHDHLKYLLLYVCSLDDEYPYLFIEMLKQVFTSSDKSLEERRASVMLASSFISRANYVPLRLLFDYLEFANNWCCQVLEDPKVIKDESASENLVLFYSLTQSMFYLITQRYREMYEEEILNQLNELKLEKLVESHLKPLEVCDAELQQRFREVAALYKIVESISINHVPTKKRRKSDVELKNQLRWKAPYNESERSVPDRVRPLYRSYFDHRNFTIYRE